MNKPDFNKYYRYEELIELLQGFAAEHPNLVRLEQIGKSFEGRVVYIAKATNYNTGGDREKPAVWIDANIHALEVSTTAVALYYLYALTSKYGVDRDITRAMDTRAFYILPRISPDGAEWALADDPKIVRSSTRPYPYYDEPIGGGLMEKDLDGDRRILFMRYPDANGAWKEHPDYPGLMIKREPSETGGRYYRVLPEGLIDEYDGDTIDVRSIHAQVTWPKGSWPKEGLDLNRNLPVNWRPESEQLGAGPFPCSEPEIKAMVDFVINHPNIISTNSFHTFGAVILRPMDGLPDDEMIPEDLRVFERMCDVAAGFTDYPAMSAYPNFCTRPNMIYAGAVDSWFYDHLGKLAWGVELWNPLRAIGKKNYHVKYFKWFGEHPVEDDVALYKWAKETWGDEGYVDWYEFDHPQLGKVELGGWNWAHTWANIPERFQEQEVAPFEKWFTWSALVSPLLGKRDLRVTPLGGGNYHVRFVLENTGYLPTYVTKKALERRIRGIICELELPEGATLASGLPRQDIGQLEGYAHKDAFLNPKQEGTRERAKVDWVIHAPNGGKIKITAKHDQAGVVREEAELANEPVSSDKSH